MNITRAFALTLCSIVAVVSPLAAQDGAALYKARCAGCHGANGEGKPAMKAPALRGTSVGTEQLTARLTKGVPGSRAPHSKGMAGLKEDQAKAIAEYVKSLK